MYNVLKTNKCIKLIELEPVYANFSTKLDCNAIQQSQYFTTAYNYISQDLQLHFTARFIDGAIFRISVFSSACIVAERYLFLLFRNS